MLGDLVRLYEVLKKASTHEQEEEAQKKLAAAVEAEVRSILVPSQKRPKGQAKFKTISQGLGIYNGKDDELRNRLFEIGARPITGDDGTEYWWFPSLPDQQSATLQAISAPNAPQPRRSVTHVFAAVVAVMTILASGVAVLEFAGISGKTIFSTKDEEPTLRSIFGGD